MGELILEPGLGELFKTSISMKKVFLLNFVNTKPRINAL